MSKRSNNIHTDRRNFLGQAGAAAALAAGAIGLEPLFGSAASEVRAAAVGTAMNTRRNRAYTKRHQAATDNMAAMPVTLKHPTNTDDDAYADKRGSYTKGLPHNADGTVVLSAYQSLVGALTNGEGKPALFDQVQIGLGRKLTNPQAGFCYEIEGGDAHSFVQPPAPAFASKEECAEIAENYWMALLRDVPFSDYASHPVAAAAAADLTNFGADFKGAKNNSGVVTPRLLFRGVTPGDKVGPYLSQYFYLPCNFGANQVSQRIQTFAPVSTVGNNGSGGGQDYMTKYADWLAIQRGGPSSADILDGTRRYMRMGRDIARWVQVDVLFQGYFQAFLVLAGLGAPVDESNPYNASPTQIGFGTFGGPHIATLLCEVSTRALHAVWYQKWMVHRRLRPEAFAGRIERNRTHPGRFDVHNSINSSTVLNAVKQHNEQFNGVGQGTYLLPMAFPEGSPTHPSYGAGHATVAGACTTILKAWFKEDTPIASLTQPLQPTPDGLALIPYTESDAGQVTVGGELNKIAYNVANGRNISGVHWRSDSRESIALGEAIAIQILKEHRARLNAVPHAWTAGALVTIVVTNALCAGIKRFFRKVMRADHRRLPFTIGMDKSTV
ncbi:MAG: vanadium-dependent haloperoxidase [Acidobacteria bacterium]|nr:vanadium-dependent haloperoxidase [Acidobacteriota bacterium]MCA1619581.1 vanadium-dependent haloperoxidase [Acidobacteriota bacterium]